MTTTTTLENIPVWAPIECPSYAKASADEVAGLPQDADEQRRIFLQFVPANVPGPAEQRHVSLAAAYCGRVLGRGYEYGRRDWAYYLAPDEATTKTCWMIVDLNVRQDGVETESIPFSCVHARYDSAQQPIFRPGKRMPQNIATYHQTYRWGGRVGEWAYNSYVLGPGPVEPEEREKLWKTLRQARECRATSYKDLEHKQALLNYQQVLARLPYEK